MIERVHDDGATRSVARYSDCETYRYLLTRQWGDGPHLLWVMLNPSTATELANDPTIARCESRARGLGYGAVGIVNLFALRETEPRRMLAHPAPTGTDNDPEIRQALDWADDVIAAWGNDAMRHKRPDDVRHLLRHSGKPIYTLIMNKTGHPRHPLYVAETQKLMRWQP